MSWAKTGRHFSLPAGFNYHSIGHKIELIYSTCDGPTKHPSDFFLGAIGATLAQHLPFGVVQGAKSLRLAVWLTLHSHLCLHGIGTPRPFLSNRTAFMLWVT